MPEKDPSITSLGITVAAYDLAERVTKQNIELKRITEEHDTNKKQLTEAEELLRSRQQEIDALHVEVNTWRRKADAVRLDPVEQENVGLKLKVGALQRDLDTKQTTLEHLRQDATQWKQLAEDRNREIVSAAEIHATTIARVKAELNSLEDKFTSVEQQYLSELSKQTVTETDCINKIAKRMYQIADEHGFHEGDEEFPTIAGLVEARMSEYVANIHGEVSELWEAYRNSSWHMPCNKQTHGVSIGLTCAEEELADIVIRSMDVAVAINIDLGRAIKIKSDYNNLRPYRHGGKKA